MTNFYIRGFLSILGIKILNNKFNNYLKSKILKKLE